MNFTTKDMMYVSLMAAIVAVLGFIPPIALPFGVPITLQTLGVMLAGTILGARLGGISLLIFVLLVTAGTPILSGGRGGLGILLGATGGYVLSWPIAAFIIGYLVEKYWNKLTFIKVFLINILGGIIIVYAIGIPYYVAVTEVDFFKALIGNLIFIPGDLVKVLIATWLAIKMKNIYPIIKK